VRLNNPVRLSEIDDSNRSGHFHLTAADICYFLYEYTSGHNYEFSGTNSRISNLKKKPSQRGQQHYQYKEGAIRACARDFSQALNAQWLAQATLVPVPGSKAMDHPDHDDRMVRICNGISQPPPDVRLLVLQSQSTNASHEAHEGERVTVEELTDLYSINENIANPAPSAIAIVDDLLTAGTHFRAMKDILTTRFPGVPIIGLFVARRVFPENPFANFA
jgi:predicted amidophosphoribosyltransferase